jgi:hypothetical protein
MVLPAISSEESLVRSAGNTLRILGGVSGDAFRPDNIVYDIVNPVGLPIGVSASGWGHAACRAAATSFAGMLPAVRRCSVRLVNLMSLDRLVDDCRELTFNVRRVDGGYFEMPITRRQIRNLHTCCTGEAILYIM